MKRDLKKALQEYEKSFGGNDGRGAFYIDDYKQIIEMTDFYKRGDIIETVITALKIGFIIGRRSK